MMTKQHIRKMISAKRQALSNHDIEPASRHIVATILEQPAFQKAQCVALYKAIFGEVTLEPLFEHCWAQNKRTLIPVFNPETKRYELIEVDAVTQYKTGNYGIQEPIPPHRLKSEEIDLFLVPGVAFDRTGNRLGRGGGYYDRMLALSTAPRIGICFHFQLLDQLPTEPHDVPVQIIITDKTVKRLKED
jgi:5-formyltetrahydrofolate cyclo-ligase